MKPLPKSLFAPLELTAAQEDQYERLAHSLIRETMGDYDQFVTVDKRTVNQQRWKTVIKRDNVTVYKDRVARSDTIATPAPSKNPTLEASTGLDTSRFASTTSDLPSKTSSTSNLPKLLALGSIHGSLDDVMYGMVTTNSSSMRLRSSYVDDHITDGAVLYQMKGPTPNDPFRFLGIKWIVKGERRVGVKKIVRPRDFVFLEYSGVMSRPNGDRLGFHLMHSVDIPSCPELRERHILRAKLSSCYLYREMPGVMVDLYMTARVEPRGRVFESVAIRSAAGALSSCWKSVACAQNKKLAWVLQNERQSNLSQQGAPSRYSQYRQSNVSHRASQYTNTRDSRAGSAGSAKADAFPENRCGVCTKGFGTFSKRASCQLCFIPICSRCQIRRKLSSERLDAKIQTTKMMFCKSCISGVGEESASDIAKQEIWDERIRTRTRASSMRQSNALTVRESQLTIRDGSMLIEQGTYSTIIEDEGFDAVDSRPRQLTVSSDSQASWRPSSAGSERRSSWRPSSAGSERRSSCRPSASGKQLSWGPTGVLRNTTTTDVLSLADLYESEVDEDEEEEDEDEPILLSEAVVDLDFRVMDYINPPVEEDDDLESRLSSLYQESEVDSRMSYTSSIAVLDSEYSAATRPSYQPDEARVHEITEEDDEDDDEAKDKMPELRASIDALVVRSQLNDELNNWKQLEKEQEQQPQTRPNRSQSYQMQLWMRMNDLRDTAESTYQLAKSNTETLLSQGTLGHEQVRQLRSQSQYNPFILPSDVVANRSARAMTTAPKKSSVV